ncbi:hypothetical protein HYX02_06130 [Candidatus Woesearchaeota archaeon]|nr:hypothetical protein [Candidatus Woesearchaeota archaeon]
MIKGGTGGSLTKSGLRFESRTDLKNLFSRINGYKINGNDLIFNDKLVAQLYKKHEFYKNFLSKLKVDWKTKISKKLIPDDSIFVISGKTIFIIEIKFQEVEGSVDEKLQTCDFKKRQYNRLLEGTGIGIEYVYVLNDWFNDPAYRDVLKYIKSVDCHYFFNELPLDFLGLPKSK